MGIIFLITIFLLEQFDQEQTLFKIIQKMSDFPPFQFDNSIQLNSMPDITEKGKKKSTLDRFSHTEWDNFAQTKTLGAQVEHFSEDSHRLQDKQVHYTFQRNELTHLEKYTFDNQTLECDYLTRQISVADPFFQYYDDEELKFWEGQLTKNDTPPDTKEDILVQLLKKTKKTKNIKDLIFLAIQRLPQMQSRQNQYFVNRSPQEKASQKAHFKTLKELDYASKAQGHIWLAKQENISQFTMFKSFIQVFEIGDYSFLYKKQQMLEKFMDKVIANWGLLSPIYQPLIEHFLDLIKIKIEFMSQSRIIYPTLYRIQRKLQHALDYQGSRRNISVDDHLTDLLFQHYIQEVQTRSTRSTPYYVTHTITNQRILLSDYIAQFSNFFEAQSSWRQIFFIVTQHLTRGKYAKENESCQTPMDAFMKNIPFIVLPSQNCLSCSQFFYANQNIYFPEICKHIVALMGPIERIDESAVKITEEVCALLNGSGGVLLFNCIKSFVNIIPQGTKLIEKEKEEIQHKLFSFLNGIYPKPQKDKEICFSWVPLVQDPFEVKQISNRTALNFQVGVYVARIIVKKTFGHVVYFWTHEDQPIFSIRTKSLFSDGKRQISGRNFHKYIKQKFKTFEYQLQDMDPIERKLMIATCRLPHDCKKPETGLKMMQKHVQANAIIQNPETIYKYTSIVVAKPSDIGTIKKNLLKYNIECYIIHPFMNQKIKGATNSAILYHNTRYDQITSVISNNSSFKFSGRNLSLIYITQYIRLTNRNQRDIMREADYSSLTVWLQKRYPSQTLRMWKFITENNDQEFYMQTGSKESLLYIYIVMTQFLERCSFKNPKDLDRMDERERLSRFRQVYPSRI